MTHGGQRSSRGGVMFDARDPMHVFRRSIVAIVATVAMIAAAVPAGAQTPPVAERRFPVMTYNVYLGANLQPLFGETDPIRLIQKAAAIFAHLAEVDFNDRAVAIARQIGEQQPDVVALQEVSLWETAPMSDPSRRSTAYDFLAILLAELERQGHPYRAASVEEGFHGELPISLTPPTLGIFTDRNVLIARADLPVSELRTSNPMDGEFRTALQVPLGGQIIRLERGWASVDVMLRGKTYRLFDTHFEAFNPLIRTAQVGELVDIMSASPYPVVLAGDINVYPKDVRPEDAQAWALLTGAGFVDAWTSAGCFEPRFTAGQTDDLDNVPSALDNTVYYVLFDADTEIEPVAGSCDIAGEELDDRTDTTPAMWPSDHAAVAVEMHIAKP